MVEFKTEKNTKSSDKPNEDSFLADCDNGIFIIVDGVSRDRKNGTYPNPSPALQVSELFIESSYNYLRDNSDKMGDYLQLIKNAFSVGNQAVCNFNLAYSGNFYPGTVGIIVIIKDDEMYYGYIGDCCGILLAGEEKEKFTECQTELIHAHIKEFTASQVRNEICNNAKHPYSYGVLDGREGALDFVVTGKLILTKYDELLLYTDGLEQIIEKINGNDILHMTVDDIFNYENNENTDDKTLIVVRILKDENNM
jgi:serine/threonine protein phosphatase PrpC